MKIKNILNARNFVSFTNSNHNFYDLLNNRENLIYQSSFYKTHPKSGEKIEIGKLYKSNNFKPLLPDKSTIGIYFGNNKDPDFLDDKGNIFSIDNHLSNVIDFLKEHNFIPIVDKKFLGSINKDSIRVAPPREMAEYFIELMQCDAIGVFSGKLGASTATDEILQILRKSSYVNYNPNCVFLNAFSNDTDISMCISEYFAAMINMQHLIYLSTQTQIKKSDATIISPSVIAKDVINAHMQALKYGSVVEYAGLEPLNKPAKNIYNIDGKIYGGNAGVIVHNMHKKWNFFDLLKDNILLSEDYEMNLNSLCRRCDAIIKIGEKSQVKSIILGDWYSTPYANGEKSFSDADKIISDHASRTNIPVFKLPIIASHSASSGYPVAFGSSSRICMMNNKYTLYNDLRSNKRDRFISIFSSNNISSDNKFDQYCQNESGVQQNQCWTGKVITERTERLLNKYSKAL